MTNTVVSAELLRSLTQATMLSRRHKFEYIRYTFRVSAGKLKAADLKTHEQTLWDLYIEPEFTDKGRLKNLDSSRIQNRSLSFVDSSWTHELKFMFNYPLNTKEVAKLKKRLADKEIRDRNLARERTLTQAKYHEKEYISHINYLVENAKQYLEQLQYFPDSLRVIQGKLQELDKEIAQMIIKEEHNVKKIRS